jgi:hypothetical protein
MRARHGEPLIRCDVPGNGTFQETLAIAKVTTWQTKNTLSVTVTQRWKTHSRPAILRPVPAPRVANRRKGLHTNVTKRSARLARRTPTGTPPRRRINGSTRKSQIGEVVWWFQGAPPLARAVR